MGARAALLYPRRSIANLIHNGDMTRYPLVNTPQTQNALVDGTAGGSFSNFSFGGWWFGGNANTTCQFDPTTPPPAALGLPASLKLRTLVSNAFALCRSNYSNAYFGYRGFTLVPGTQYTLTYWMKTNYVSGDQSPGDVGAFIQVMRSDANGNNTFESSSPYVVTTTDWTKYMYKFTAGATDVLGHLELRIQGMNGHTTLVMDAWYAAICLVPTNSGWIAP